jgi:phosphatidate cytidylyltransferase
MRIRFYHPQFHPQAKISAKSRHPSEIIGNLSSRDHPAVLHLASKFARNELPSAGARDWIPTQMADPSPTPAPSRAAVFVRRTASTLLLWGIVGAGIASMKSWAYLALITVLILLSTIEYFRMLKAAGVFCFPKLGLAISAAYCALVCYGFAKGGTSILADLDLLAIVISITAAFTLQLRHPIRGNEALLSVAANLLGFVYLAFLFSFVTRIVFMSPGTGEVPGAFMLLWLIAVTKFTDMGAYIVGSMIGRHKMIPHISPGKTWEGFGGAILFSQLAACGLYALLPVKLAALHSWGQVIALGFIIALLAVIGDLAESVVKRALGAKDSGRMLPGIGGALDLIDSICFTAPALYFYLKWVLP